MGNVAGIMKSSVRRGVVWYSVRNRRRKAAAISQWMDEHDCETVLFVGTLGSDNTDPNTAIVEDAIAAGRTVKMGINIYPCETTYPFMVADGRDMPFDDDYVDFALANAIIEHVGDESDQRQFVAEQTRVARCWVITTPNKWFPVESHTSVIVAHWFPAWRRGRSEFTRLLSLREFKKLLPEGATVTGSWWSPTFAAYFDSQRGARIINRRATEAEVRASFDRGLNDAVTQGVPAPSDQGFCAEVDKAIHEVAKSWPDVDSKLVQEAKIQPENQFNGVLNRQHRALLEGWLATARRRKKRRRSKGDSSRGEAQ